MPQSVELAIANLQDKSITAGCADAPDVAIEQMGPSVFSLAYELEGELKIHSAGFAHDLATIRVQHHTMRSILPKDIAKVAAIRDTFLDAIRDDPSLGSTCDTVISVRRIFGAMEFGANKTIGYQYDVLIKLTT